MPTQLYENTNISFICAKNFTYGGVDYKLGDEWDQDLGVGRLDTLVRSRYLYAVVDSTDEKPRHWHHHIWLRKDIEKKLGILRDEDDDNVQGSSLYNSQKQNEIEQPVQDYKAMTPWEETEDNSAALQAKAEAAFYEQKVLDEENADEDEEVDSEDEETEPENFVEPAEVEEEEDDEEEVVAEDLYDPAEHTVDEVLDYLSGDISEAEFERVVTAERVNKNRKGIVEHV